MDRVAPGIGIRIGDAELVPDRQFWNEVRQAVSEDPGPNKAKSEK